MNEKTEYVENNWYENLKNLPLKDSKFSIAIEGNFESSHFLRKYYPNGEDEISHGHSWKIEIYLNSVEKTLKKNGIIIDFLSCQTALHDACNYLDHTHLNDLPDFVKINPSAENICLWFYNKLELVANKSGGSIYKVILWEGANNRAILEI
jgi:6-pyruvoyltetrahydropterin/6-carboxytetrahydropterin synthase